MALFDEWLSVWLGVYLDELLWNAVGGRVIIKDALRDLVELPVRHVLDLDVNIVGCVMVVLNSEGMRFVRV